MKAIGVLFRVYRLVLSPAFHTAFGIQCRHEESCSRFMERALRERGMIRGFFVGMRRLISCNGWSNHG